MVNLILGLKHQRKAFVFIFEFLNLTFINVSQVILYIGSQFQDIITIHYIDFCINSSRKIK
jgi:hypothetical protein